MRTAHHFAHGAEVRERHADGDIARGAARVLGHLPRERDRFRRIGRASVEPADAVAAHVVAAVAANAAPDARGRERTDRIERQRTRAQRGDRRRGQRVRDDRVATVRQSRDDCGLDRAGRVDGAGHFAAGSACIIPNRLPSVSLP